MRFNLTKKDLINTLYMQIGFSKKISENLLDDILETIILNLRDNNKLKISKFGTFIICVLDRIVTMFFSKSLVTNK